MSNYDPVAQSIIQQAGLPYKNLIVDIRETEKFPGVVFLCLYAHNLADFSDDQAAGIAEWLTDVKRKLNTHPLVTAKYGHVVSQEDPP